MIRIFLTLMLLSVAAIAQTPIPIQGDSCPTGTFKSKEYCIPKAKSAESDENIIPKQGKHCPTGFYSSGSYCKKFSGSGKEAIPMEISRICPNGWYKSRGNGT